MQVVSTSVTTFGREKIGTQKIKNVFSKISSILWSLMHITSLLSYT